MKEMKIYTVKLVEVNGKGNTTSYLISNRDRIVSMQVLIAQ